MRVSAALAGTLSSDKRPRVGRMLVDGLERGGLIILLLAVFAFFSLDPTSGPTFATKANLDNILGNQSVTALVALAMVVPLTAGYFDLSVSATTGLTNVAVASAIGIHGAPIWLGVLIGCLLGVGVGVVNGLLVAGLRLSAFVVTLGSYTFLGGIVLWYTKGALIVQGIPPSFGNWGSGSFIGLPKPFVLLLVVAVAVWYLLMQTPYGRYLEGIGSNESAARLVGINVDRVIWLSFIISGLLAGAAGALQTSRAAGADPTVGSSFLFPAVAAVFLGATTIRPGRYNVWGTVVGIFFVAESVSGFALLGADVWVQPVFNGAALVVAVALSTLIARARVRSRTRALEAAVPDDEAVAGSPRAGVWGLRFGSSKRQRTSHNRRSNVG